eukprot:10100338-Karenia_brevis.AAC.1
MMPLDASGKLPPTQYFPPGGTPSPNGLPASFGQQAAQPPQSGSNVPPTQPYPITPGQLPSNQPTQPG